MKGIQFPLIKVRTGSEKSYDLNSVEGRKEYFLDRCPEEIEALKKYLETNTFIAYMVGKKQAGKGTYTKLFAEIFGSDKVAHLSVGDLVRETDSLMSDTKEKEALYKYLEKNYRGYIPLDEAFDSFTNRSTTKLLPTEFILALIKRKIDALGRKVLFIDGFPRDMDQVSYSLYFRDLINYREDPDLFMLIDIPEAVIDERIKLRRVCPKCNTSRNLSLFPTSDVRYDKDEDQFYLMCDNKDCEPTRMVGKEGDEKGIESIRERTELDDKLLRMALNLQGIPKVLLRNSVPKDEAVEYVDTFELTPKTTYEREGDKVVAKESEWEFEDDDGVTSYSLKAAPVVASMVKQLKAVLID